MLSNDWKIPLNIAVGLHVLILLGGLYLPGIFKAKPKFADIYTVSIINIAEPAATEPPPSAQSAEEPPPVTARPVKAKKIAPIAEPVKQPVVSPPKSVSLKPLKKKKVVKVEKREDDHAQKERERQRRQKLAEALREEELLEEKAQLAREALEAERRLLQSQRAAASQPAVAKGSGTGSASNSNSIARGSSNILESQLYALIKNRLAQYWVLPDYLQKDISLTATAVITINRDGSVANMFFENRSGNRVFDQFVKKTIESADPFPPIPPAMKKQRFEVGLVFRPAGIQ